MDVWQITVAALRRWYVFLPLLALTGLAAFMVGQGVAPQYEVRATAILVPGSVPTEIESPYGSMDSTATVLGIVLDDAATRERISAQGMQPDYEFTPRNRSRIVDIEVLSDSPERSLATGNELLALASQELADRQAEVGIPANAQVGLQVLQAPAVSDVVSEGKLRNMAVIGILGAALSLLVAVLFDDLVGLFRGRRRRRERRNSQPDASAEQEASTLDPEQQAVAAWPIAAADEAGHPGPSSTEERRLARASRES